MVPRILTDDRKCQLHISSDVLHNVEMFDRVTTSDETCFQYDSEMKCQSMQWKTQNSHWLPKALMSHSHFKGMLVCFFDLKKIVHYEFIAQRQTVNQRCCVEVLTRLQGSVQRKRPELWPDKWILHHYGSCT
jgi:mannosyltransferase OCH1-like enzyme